LCFPYINRFIPLPPGWGDWRRMPNSAEAWRNPINAVTTLTTQLNDQRTVVAQQEQIVAALEAKRVDLAQQLL